MFTFFLVLVGLTASFASPLFNDEQALGDRIVGGVDGTIEEVPYLVSVQYDGSHSCAGSIISEYWVLSATHCYLRPHSRFTVRAGSSMRLSGGVTHAVERIINHASYGSPATYSNDIALIKVVEPFQFSAQVQAIDLPSQLEEVTPNTITTIAGWGRTSWFLGVPAEIVQIAEVPTVSIAQCRSAYTVRQISDDMLCAGLPQGGVDACQGDSGGPLSVDGVLQGVVSWGRRCASSRFPGVYAKVSHFRDWITENSGV